MGSKNGLHQKGRFFVCVKRGEDNITRSKGTHFQIYVGLGFGTKTLLEIREIQQKTERLRDRHKTPILSSKRPYRENTAHLCGWTKEETLKTRKSMPEVGI